MTNASPSQSSLLDKVERLRAILIARATGQPADNDEYVALRRELMAVPQIRPKLPQCVARCFTLGDFWDYIKPKFGTYAERRSYLREEFRDLRLQLEETEPPIKTTAVQLSNVSSEHVTDAWFRLIERMKTDPAGAITAARTLLETVCKHILDDEGVTYKDSADLPELYNLVAQQLSLAPSQHTEQAFKQILGGCVSVVNGLATLRNRLSDAHGGGRSASRPAPRHAALAVNMAGAIASFLVETWEARKAQAPTTNSTE